MRVFTSRIDGAPEPSGPERQALLSMGGTPGPARTGEVPLATKTQTTALITGAGCLWFGIRQLRAENLMPNKTIAYKLGLNEKTVRNHVSSMYEKLQIFDRAQAVRQAHHRVGNGPHDAARIDRYIVHSTSVCRPRRNATDWHIPHSCFTGHPRE